MKKIFLLPLVTLAATLALLSCSHLPESMTEIEYPPTLTSARNSIDKKNYLTAEKQIQAYLSNPNDIHWHGHAYLLLGEAREDGGRLTEAVDAYKHAVTQGAAYDQKIMVKALYRISWIYEREGEYKDLLVVLNDLEKTLTSKDVFVKYVETPARMANVYFALDNWEKALEMREKSHPELNPNGNNVGAYEAKLYRSFAALDTKVIAPQGVTPEQLLSLVQKELLEVGEMGAVATAHKAYASLLRQYQHIWKPMQDVKKMKTKEEQINYNKGHLELLAKFLDQIEELKASRRPSEVLNNPTLNKDFFNQLDKIEKEVRRQAQDFNFGPQKEKQKKSGH